MDHNKVWKILREMGIPDCLTCLLRNLYAGSKATVRTGHGTTDWLEETQGGIKIARRNINNLRYADDTTFKAESKELKTLLMKEKEESEKAGLKLNILKTKIMAFGRWGNSGNSG